VVKIFHHTISNELPLDSAEHSVLQTETKLNLKANPEKTITLMFDVFNVSSFTVKSKQFFRCAAHEALMVFCFMEMIVFRAQF
jgi:actin-related protein